MVYLSLQISKHDLYPVVKRAIEVAFETACDDSDCAEVFSLNQQLEDILPSASDSQEKLMALLEEVEEQLDLQGLQVFSNTDTCVIADKQTPEEGDWVTEDFFDFRHYSITEDRYLSSNVYSCPDDWQTELQAKMEEEQFFIPRVWHLSDEDEYTLIQGWQPKKEKSK